MENMALIVIPVPRLGKRMFISAFRQIESRWSSYLGQPEEIVRCVGAGLSIRLNPAVRGCASIF
jgi:hypothetical protein